MTQLQAARGGEITAEMAAVAEAEGLPPETIRERVARGTVVIPANRQRKLARPQGIGQGLRVKVNANIGTSPERFDVEEELAKLRTAIDAGADAVMDLSTGGDISAIRRRLLEECPVPFGTVPIYQAAVNAQAQGKLPAQMDEEELFAVLEEHARDGVDFFVVHAGITREGVRWLRREGRLTDIVSRGGAFLASWMLHNERENPYFEHFDRVVEIAREYDVTISLGDGLRPGCLADATDRAQVHELMVVGELVDRAREGGAQVMVEGPGHVPLDQIAANIRLQKRVCHEAPFYVLGPLVTDIAPGYDHITAAIGGAVAAWEGADFLCYVTPSEHLGLPGAEDVRIGVICARIAAHAGDVARGRGREWDDEMARARKALDWEEQARLAIDPEKVRRYRESRAEVGCVPDPDVCSMCGKLCSMKLTSEAFSKF